MLGRTFEFSVEIVIFLNFEKFAVLFYFILTVLFEVKRFNLNFNGFI